MSEVLNVKVERLARLDNGSKIRAFCDLLFGGLFLIKGFRVVEGENGAFIGMPQHQSKHGKWFDVFVPGTPEIREYITEVIMQAYKGEEQ